MCTRDVTARAFTFQQRQPEPEPEQHVADNNLRLPHLSFTARRHCPLYEPRNSNLHIDSEAKLGSCTHCHDKSIGLCAPVAAATAAAATAATVASATSETWLLAPCRHLVHSSNMQLTLTYVNVDKRVKTRAAAAPTMAPSIRAGKVPKKSSPSRVGSDWNWKR